MTLFYLPASLLISLSSRPEVVGWLAFAGCLALLAVGTAIGASLRR